MNTKNSNTYCAAVHWHKPLLLSTWPGVLFLIQFMTRLWGSITHSYSSHPFLCALAYNDRLPYIIDCMCSGSKSQCKSCMTLIQPTAGSSTTALMIRTATIQEWKSWCQDLETPVQWSSWIILHRFHILICLSTILLPGVMREGVPFEQLHMIGG